MTRHIPTHHLASHKAKVRKIAHDLNKSWSNTFHNWFSVCDIANAYDDLWGGRSHLEHHYDVLREFHCMKWKHIGPEGKATIVKHVLSYLQTPYLAYNNGRFFMIDHEAIKVEEERKANEPRSWVRRLCDKLFGDPE